MGLALFTLLLTFWSGAFVAIKIIVLKLPPLLGASLRVGLAFLILFALLSILKKRLALPITKVWKVWIAGIFLQGIPFALLFWGEQRVTPGLASIINGTVPIWTFALGLFFFKKTESYSQSQFYGVLIGLCGLLLVYSTQFQTFNRDELFGMIAITAMAISYALGTLWNRLIFSEKTDLFTSLFHQHLSSGFFLLLSSLIIEGLPSLESLSSLIHSPETQISLVYLSLFSTVLGWVLYLKLIQRWGALKASTAYYFVPLLGLLSDFIYFGNSPSGIQILGTGTIILGIVLTHQKQN